MSLHVEYAVDAVVGVVRDGTFSWYVTEKELWFLDQHKLRGAFRARGYVIDESLGSDRFDIDVVNETTADAFLAAIHEHRVEAEALRALLEEMIEHFPEDGIEQLVPAILVDFDEKRLMSMFPEPSSFEDFVPDGWTGTYAGFLDRVPVEQRYWMVDGRNLFKAGVD